MICIKESISGDQVSIAVEGKLDRDSLPTLKDVCNHHLEPNKGLPVIVSFQGLEGIGREAIKYLRDIKDRVHFIDMPDFLKMELFSE